MRLNSCLDQLQQGQESWVVHVAEQVWGHWEQTVCATGLQMLALLYVPGTEDEGSVAGMNEEQKSVFPLEAFGSGPGKGAMLADSCVGGLGLPQNWPDEGLWLIGDL